MDNAQSALDALAACHRKLVENIVRPYAAGASNGWANALAQGLAAYAASQAERWQARQAQFLRDHLELWRRCIGEPAEPSIEPPADRRFQSAEWREPYFAYLAHAYLLGRRHIDELIAEAPLDARAKGRLAFLARQYGDAMCPANFAWTNPQALKRAYETRGESFAAGLKNLRADLDLGRVSNVDRTAFRIGGNVATTPGAVVFENELIQLIQYRAATPRVHERPLLIVPPCINKYYILDLQDGNSFVRYAVSRGHTVFMVSWRNAGADLARLTWDDYLASGILQAIAVAREICGVDEINALGFCIGGTLLATGLAVLHAKGERPVKSLTLLATLLDYGDAGELGMFIDETYVAQRERELAAAGLLRGEELALAFASLRANDLVWRYVVNNYLLGHTPAAFDLLYWNDDSTNLPGPMYLYYLRNMYLENNLRVPGKLALCGVPVDLGRIDLPAYAVAAREDHIVPWRTAYSSARLLKSKIEFVLTASGHIAGVVNPPPGTRRRYWCGTDADADADAWLAAAICRDGSWWPHWARWLAKHAGQRIARRTVGTAQHPEIEPAPGRYVREAAQPAAAQRNGND